ncbi:MAG: quinone-dependent dihydroorotate dehydrogenase [Deltaproteobacteria bacterium]|nr:quinone-dependent dihydroorotate dehydrogenase [Deltaproteobacteria bacterium]
MYKLLRPLLFKLDSESAHHLLIKVSQLAKLAPIRQLLSTIYAHNDPALKLKVFDLNFDNPIGLAAGFDKECQMFELLSAIGFGSVEFGTITAQPQPGNPRPRIFRLPEDEALINRMGFPSQGADLLAKRLSLLPRNAADRIRIGINIGKTKAVPIERAQEDYVASFSKLKEYGDYFVLNVSSPNTPELRMLQERTRLNDLLRALQAVNIDQAPLLIKVAPDLSYAEIDDILECCQQHSISGIIATNTTFSRDGLKSSSSERGGLSGRPLFARSYDIVSYIAKRTERKFPIVAVGGVFSAEDAYKMMQAGASLVQVYTALVYEGPAVVMRIKRGLSKIVAQEGVSSISELISR